MRCDWRTLIFNFNLSSLRRNEKRGWLTALTFPWIYLFSHVFFSKELGLLVGPFVKNEIDLGFLVFAAICKPCSSIHHRKVESVYDPFEHFIWVLITKSLPPKLRATTCFIQKFGRNHFLLFLSIPIMWKGKSRKYQSAIEHVKNILQLTGGEERHQSWK